jgi:chemotaxis signal transduction protein
MDILETGSPTGDLPTANADAGDFAAHDPRARERMLVRMGELGLLIPWDGGREVAPVPPTSRVPNTATWLHGLANVRGGLVPVVDVAAAFGIARSTRADYVLICGHGEAAIGLLIDGLPRTFDVGAATAVSVSELTASALDTCVRARYRHEDRVWLDVDLESLFDALGRGIALA